METYYQILKINLKYNLFPHILITFLLFLVAPFIMGLENLNSIQTAQVLEAYVSLFGIILLVPLFIPDQDRNIRDLLESKKESMMKIQFIRILEAIFVLSLIVFMFLLKLKYGQSEFLFFRYFYGIMANCIFLGGLGVFFFSIMDNLVVAYMVPLLYYILNYGSGEKLGRLNILSMMRGSFVEKKYLLSIGILLIVMSIFYRHFRRE